jgi:hypothetical protein
VEENKRIEPFPYLIFGVNRRTQKWHDEENPKGQQGQDNIIPDSRGKNSKLLNLPDRALQNNKN